MGEKVMDNLEYLESIKEADKDTNKDDIDWFSHRKIKALEIIAEEFIGQNESLKCVVSELENIQTILNRR
jgi:hypothetical protein